MKQYLMLLVALFLNSTIAFAHEDKDNGIEKIYIQSHQVSISDAGIFIHDDFTHETVVVDKLEYDAVNGLYYNACKYNHGIICKKCNGCAVRHCFYMCRCYPN